MDRYYRHFRNGQFYRFVPFATIEATGETVNSESIFELTDSDA